MSRFWAMIAWGTVFTLACGRPPLRVSRAGTAVRVDVRTLGEYQTSVHRVRLSCDGRVVLDVRARGPVLQVDELVLRPGDNSLVQAGLSGAEFAVVPGSGANFEIPPETNCLLEVWGRASDLSLASARLEF